MIELRIDRSSGVPPYWQIVQQVRAGVQLGLLLPGEQLPTADALVEQLGINRNTAVKAYHELKASGLVKTIRGRGTFIARVLPRMTAPTSDRLRHNLDEWLHAALRAGLDDDSIRALVSRSLNDAA